MSVAVLYAATAWALVQISSTVVPILGWPDWTLKLVLILLLLGFPVAMVLAWAFDLTPSGIRRHGERVDGEALRTGTAARWLVAAGVLSFFLAGGYAIYGRLRIVGASGFPIAVLPFVNLHGDSAAAAIADGLSAELLDDLGGQKALKVIGRSTVLQYRDSASSRSALLESFGRITLLKGLIERRGAEVTADLSISDGATGRVLWRSRFAQPDGDMRLLKQQILDRLLKEFRIRPDTDSDRFGGASTAAAYDDFLRARSYLDRPSRESQDLGGSLLHKALAEDPTFAPAYALLAAYFVRQRWNFGGPHEFVDSAVDAAGRAVAADVELPAAHNALGVTDLARGAFADARAEFETAVRLNPSDGHAYAYLITLHAMAGRYDEAVAAYTKALKLDPVYARGSQSNVATSYASIGMFEEAERGYRAILARDPGALFVQRSLLHLLITRGDTAAALALSAEMLRRHPTDPSVWLDRGEALVLSGDAPAAQLAFTRAMQISEDAEGWKHSAPLLLAYACLQTGDRSQARALLDRYQVASEQRIAAGDEDRLMYYGLAAMHAMRGEISEGVADLREAVARGGVGYAEMDVDPLLEPLRADPAYTAIQQSQKSQADSMRAKIRAMRVPAF